MEHFTLEFRVFQHFFLVFFYDFILWKFVNVGGENKNIICVKWKCENIKIIKSWKNSKIPLKMEHFTLEFRVFQHFFWWFFYGFIFIYFVDVGGENKNIICEKLKSVKFSCECVFHYLLALYARVALLRPAPHFM